MNENREGGGERGAGGLHNLYSAMGNRKAKPRGRGFAFYRYCQWSLEGVVEAQAEGGLEGVDAKAEGVDDLGVDVGGGANGVVGGGSGVLEEELCDVEVEVDAHLGVEAVVEAGDYVEAEAGLFLVVDGLVDDATHVDDGLASRHDGDGEGGLYEEGEVVEMGCVVAEVGLEADTASGDFVPVVAVVGIDFLAKAAGISEGDTKLHLVVEPVANLGSDFIGGDGVRVVIADCGAVLGGAGLFVGVEAEVATNGDLCACCYCEECECESKK